MKSAPTAPPPVALVLPEKRTLPVIPPDWRTPMVLSPTTATPPSRERSPCSGASSDTPNELLPCTVIDEPAAVEIPPIIGEDPVRRTP